jgi:hypothetical protein
MRHAQEMKLRADQVREGDWVIRSEPWGTYIVEEVYTTAIGQVAHRHGDGEDYTASSAFWPWEVLRIWRDGCK